MISGQRSRFRRRNNYRYDKSGIQRQLERNKRQLKQKYGQLTDYDLAFSEGKEGELLGRLQQKLGRSKEDLRRQIEKW